VSISGRAVRPEGKDRSERDGKTDCVRVHVTGLWRDTTIIRDNVIESVRALKAEPGRNILTDGSSQLVHTLFAHDLVDQLHLLVFPLALGNDKRLFPGAVHREFALRSATPYPSGVVGLHYVRP
jgi:dihydrofolate reductase